MDDRFHLFLNRETTGVYMSTGFVSFVLSMSVCHNLTIYGMPDENQCRYLRELRLRVQRFSVCWIWGLASGSRYKLLIMNSWCLIMSTCTGKWTRVAWSATPLPSCGHGMSHILQGSSSRHNLIYMYIYGRVFAIWESFTNLIQLKLCSQRQNDDLNSPLPIMTIMWYDSSLLSTSRIALKSWLC